MNATKLYDKHTLGELTEMESRYCKNTEISEATRKRAVEAIRWAITWKLQDARAARGETINREGYSGRNSKRR